jgi:hypothetical protein
MANRALKFPKAYGSDPVIGSFQFTAAGTLAVSAPAAVNGADMVATFAHTSGTNIITVTLKDPFNLVVYCTADPRDDAGTGNWASCGSFTNEGSTLGPSFNINYFTGTGTTAVDPAFVTMVYCHFRNTAAPEGYQK